MRSKLKKIVYIGDRLVRVNNRLVVNEGPDVIDIVINTSLECGKAVELEFLNHRQLSINEFRERILKRKIYYDPLGFPMSVEEQRGEGGGKGSTQRRFSATASSSAASSSSSSSSRGSSLSLQAHQLEIEKAWFQYMKSIGGADNLKPVGWFTPSDDLSELVRRGVPIAYRALIWNKISLSDMERRKYSSSYYQTLQIRVTGEIPPKTNKEINNDIDR